MWHEANMIPSFKKFPVQEASNQASNNNQWWVSWQGKYMEEVGDMEQTEYTGLVV